MKNLITTGKSEGEKAKEPTLNYRYDCRVKINYGYNNHLGLGQSSTYNSNSYFRLEHSLVKNNVCD